MMRILVLYESFFGNTEKVANEIARALKEKNETSVVEISNLTENISEAGLIILGSPTRGFSPSPATKQFLKNLNKASLSGILVAAFDTRIALNTIENKALRIMVDKGGYAARPILKKLSRKGGSAIINAEGFYVVGEKGPLLDGEEKRAYEWGIKIAKLI